MQTQVETREEFVDTLNHISGAFDKVKPLSGIGQPLNFPDLHKLSEGLFLSAWTHWEGFCRSLMLIDLATDPAGLLNHDVKKYRTKNAPYRLAERMLNHPDHPNRFIEWNDYVAVKQRANEFLDPGHRFVSLGQLEADLAFIKRIRNAIAHKSDRAWESFRSLAKNAPFNLAPAQMKGITPGRFVSSHTWGADVVIKATIDKLEQCALQLVP